MGEELEVMSKIEKAQLIRKIFSEKGGARFSWNDDVGRICATEALYQARALALQGEIDIIATAMFGREIMWVNDELGKEEVLQVFDKYIARLEEGWNG